MKASVTDTREKPGWLSSGTATALIVACAYCHRHPGSKHDDGSGLCPGCSGSGWHVLALVERKP